MKYKVWKQEFDESCNPVGVPFVAFECNSIKRLARYFDTSTYHVKPLIRRELKDWLLHGPHYEGCKYTMFVIVLSQK